jgi:aryl-phospho-beta-D-glucosidase BglC (GH1 family)
MQTTFRRPQRGWMLALAVVALTMLLTPFLGMPIQQTSAQTTQPVWRVDSQGNITKDGQIFRVKGGSWFGLQGRFEPCSDTANPCGAPMEQYIGNVFWAPSSRTYASDAAEIKAMGINVVRLPLSHQTLDANDPQGKDPFLKNTSSVRIANSRLALETVIKELNKVGVYVLLDIHSCSNYVDWRKGRLDARPPYVDADRDNYNFKREDSSCAATNNPSTVTRIQAYDETIWRQDLAVLAGLGQSLGVSNIMGIDIFNEPWDYTWNEWKTLTEHAYQTINAVNPNILIFSQGISASAGNQDGTPDTTTKTPHGDSGIDPNWGENLYEAGANPPAIPKDRLVFSPHAYGPSVFVGKQFMDPAQPQCAGLEGDDAGDAKCNIVINPTLLRKGWDEHFGYLKALGYAVVVGEFGGNFDWPRGTSSLRDQNRFGYLTDNTTDQQWQNAFVDYLIDRNITDTIYWSINPESGDTGGLYTTPYRAGTNESGWGTWGALDSRKITMLQRLWNATPVTPTPVTPTNTPTPVTPTPVTPTPVTPTPVTGESFALDVFPTRLQLNVGDALVVVSTLTNNGSGFTFNSPQYTLQIEPQGASSPFSLLSGNPVAMPITIKPGEAASAVHTLRADRPGTVVFTVNVTGQSCTIADTPACANGHPVSLDVRSVIVEVLGDTPTPTPITPTPITPTPDTGTCSPVTRDITSPFAYDGAGTFCWRTTSLGSYINSWNLTSLKINGVDFTNRWANSYPAAIGGYYYISYSAQFSWSHFESR